MTSKTRATDQAPWTSAGLTAVAGLFLMGCLSGPAAEVAVQHGELVLHHHLAVEPVEEEQVDLARRGRREEADVVAHRVAAVVAVWRARCA